MEAAWGAPADPLDEAFRDLAEALALADPQEPGTVLPVVEGLATLNRALRGADVPAGRHAAVRAAIDATMQAVSALLSGVATARDETARALARLKNVRAAQGAFTPAAHRLDRIM